MRFRRWPRPTAYRETPRKRAAFLRKQRLEREALPLFAEAIAARQRDVDEEMAHRQVWWIDRERELRRQRAARWREARAKLFVLHDSIRRKVRTLWRTCPYPADPASFADFLHQIAVGRLDPDRPPWVFHQKTQARITTNPATFDEAFRQIGRKSVGGGPSAAPTEEVLFCGNLGSGILLLTSRVRAIDPNAGFDILPDHRATDDGRTEHRVDIDVRGNCSVPDLSLIQRLAQAADTRPVVVRRVRPVAHAPGAQ
ncbi:hypothetical protein [Aquamicrobium terrae]|uniref:Uncharacterized protein n=1 Tax=Aquamicrobium terrae TaxID=1324945 RepID=A0ABV2N6A3_9HYPH